MGSDIESVFFRVPRCYWCGEKLVRDLGDATRPPWWTHADGTIYRQRVREDDKLVDEHCVRPTYGPIASESAAAPLPFATSEGI